MGEMEPNPEAKEHNRKVKKEITHTLERAMISISGVRIPLLSQNTERIIFECNEGKVASIKPFFKIH